MFTDLTLNVDSSSCVSLRAFVSMDNSVTMKKSEIDPFSYLVELNTLKHAFTGSRISSDLSVQNGTIIFDSDMDQIKKNYGSSNDLYLYFVCPFWTVNQPKELGVSLTATKGTINKSGKQ